LKPYRRSRGLSARLALRQERDDGESCWVVCALEPGPQVGEALFAALGQATAPPANAGAINPAAILDKRLDIGSPPFEEHGTFREASLAECARLVPIADEWWVQAEHNRKNGLL
jgi:hypothetical protein